MVSHVRRIHNRRDDDPFNAPTADGLTAATIAKAATDPIENTLALNTAAASQPAINGGGVAFTASVTATLSDPQPTPSDTTSSSPPSDDSASSPAAQSNSSEIPIGTVVGACLGALAGAIILVLIGLWLYKRAEKPRPRSPSNARKVVDKERAWGKLEDDHEDKWEAKDGGNGAGGKYQQKGVVSVGPMEKLTMFKKSTPSIRTTYTTGPDGEQHEHEHEPLPTIAPFAHPFAPYNHNLPLAKQGEINNNAALPDPPQRPFLARMEAMPPISWDGDTVGRDSFLSLGSNTGISATTPDLSISPAGDMAIRTPKLTSFEPHHWQSAEVVNFDLTAAAAAEDDRDAPRGRAVPQRRKSENNPFFGGRMSTHSTHSRTRSRSQSRSRRQSVASDSGGTFGGVDVEEPMPDPPASAYTREEKGKYRAATPPSPTMSVATITLNSNNPFRDPAPAPVPVRAPAAVAKVVPAPKLAVPAAYAAEPHSPIEHIVPFHPAHMSIGSSDRALQSLIAALGPAAISFPDSDNDGDEGRLRVPSMNPSIMSESQYTETDADTLHQSWPVPPSRP